MIRQIEKKDIEDIISLENDTIGSSLGNMLNDLILNPLMGAYVYIDKELIGYISYTFDGDILEILNFCVSKECQNMGIGKKLLSYLLEDMTKKNAKSSILEVRSDNFRAIHIYEAFGYKRISIRKNYYKDSCDALVYEKSLV